MAQVRICEHSQVAKNTVKPPWTWCVCKMALVIQTHVFQPRQWLHFGTIDEPEI